MLPSFSLTRAHTHTFDMLLCVCVCVCLCLCVCVCVCVCARTRHDVFSSKTVNVDRFRQGNTASKNGIMNRWT